MSLTSTISALLPLFLLLLATTKVAASNLVSQTCKHSSLGDPNINYHFCINAFGCSPSSHHANLNRLGLISINLVKHNVTNTTSSIQGLLGKTKVVDKHMKAGLKDCLQLYSNSISTLGDAARDYRSKRLDDANIKLSSVMDDVCTCEDGFHDVGVVSPLTKQNNCTFQLSAIALSIMNMIS